VRRHPAQRPDATALAEFRAVLSRSPLASRPFRSPSLSRIVTIRSMRGENWRRYGMGSYHPRRNQRCCAGKNQNPSSSQPLGPHPESFPCVSRRSMRARHLFANGQHTTTPSARQGHCQSDPFPLSSEMQQASVAGFTSDVGYHIARSPGSTIGWHTADD